MARPFEYDFELCEEICIKVASGLNIKQVLESDPDRYPTFPTWCRWKRDNDALYNLYIKSIQDKSESKEHEMEVLKERLLKKEIDPSTYNTIVQTLKWQCAKYYPKMFGDKVDITTKGNEIKSPVLIIPEGVANELLKDLPNNTNEVDNGSKENS